MNLALWSSMALLLTGTGFLIADLRSADFVVKPYYKMFWIVLLFVGYVMLGWGLGFR